VDGPAQGNAAVVPANKPTVGNAAVVPADKPTVGNAAVVPADKPHRDETSDARRTDAHRAGTSDRADPPGPADPPDRLRASLRGVRAFLLDMDGVVVLRGAPLPGAGTAIASLAARGIPFRFLTNSSLYSREALARRLSGAGIPVGAADIVTALSASAALAARRWPEGALYVLGAPEALVEFAGQRLLSDDEASEAAREGSQAGEVAAVIVADAGSGFTFERLNTAFRLVRGGARLVAVHRNRWWLTREGATLDSGAFVRAIEYASGRRALLVGKPADSFFRTALATVGVPGELGLRDVMMVGDDLQSDIAAARRAGMRAAFVLSGKHGASDLAAARRRGGLLPDLVAPSLSEIVAALD